MENFNRLVAAALDVERVEKDEQVRKDRSQQRRGPEQSNFSQPPSKRFRGPQTPGQTSQQRQGSRVRSEQLTASVTSAPGSIVRGPAPAPCVHCGKNHPRECWRVTGACNKYGSRDHFFRDCPRNRTTSTYAQQSERSVPAAS
ncbi:hypothetical protein ACOSP7_031783 [Xanthoceras sorbifolium]